MCLVGMGDGVGIKCYRVQYVAVVVVQHACSVGLLPVCWLLVLRQDCRGHGLCPGDLELCQSDSYC